MYRKPLIIGAACCLLVQQASAAVKEITWDIGKEASVSVPRAPGEYKLIVIGRVAGADYKANVTVDTIEIPGLPQPGSVPGPGGPKTAPPPPLVSDPKDLCAPYRTLLDTLVAAAKAKFHKPDLDKASAEEDFSNARAALEAALDNPPSGCTADPLARLALTQLVAESRWDLGETYTVKRGQILKAEISRKLGAAAAERKFVYQLNTGKRGNWLASYGFGITPNDDQHFFSRANDDDTFEIAKKRDNGGVNPTAAVFYTWLPAQRETSNWNYGIAGGIGIDQNNLALFLGPHITFNQNLGLVAGIAMHQQTRLRGEYEVGQTLTETLTGDALEEKVNRTSWFIGITMRFGAPEK